MRKDRTFFGELFRLPKVLPHGKRLCTGLPFSGSEGKLSASKARTKAITDAFGKNFHLKSKKFRIISYSENSPLYIIPFFACLSRRFTHLFLRRCKIPPRFMNISQKYTQKCIVSILLFSSY